MSDEANVDPTAAELYERQISDLETQAEAIAASIAKALKHLAIEKGITVSELKKQRRAK